MDTELAASFKELLDTLRRREEAASEFQQRLLEEIKELNSNLRHIEKHLAPRDY